VSFSLNRDVPTRFLLVIFFFYDPMSNSHKGNLRRLIMRPLFVFPSAVAGSRGDDTSEKIPQLILSMLFLFFPDDLLF